MVKAAAQPVRGIFAPKHDFINWGLSGGGVRPWPEVDPEHEHTVLQASCGVAQHGEVLVIELHALDEPPAIGTLEGGNAAATNRLGPLPETGNHGVHVEVP